MAELIIQAHKALMPDDLEVYEKLQKIIRDKYLKEGL